MIFILEFICFINYKTDISFAVDIKYRQMPKVLHLYQMFISYIFSNILSMKMLLKKPKKPSVKNLRPLDTRSSLGIISHLESLRRGKLTSRLSCLPVFTPKQFLNVIPSSITKFKSTREKSHYIPPARIVMRGNGVITSYAMNSSAGRVRNYNEDKV